MKTKGYASKSFFCYEMALITMTLCIQNGAVFKETGFERGDIWCRNGRFILPEKHADQTIDAHGLLVVPGYIDLQINGGYGVDFTERPEKVGDVARKLPLHGVTSFLPTIVSTKKEDYRPLINMLQPRSIANGASILGIHLEGPFFNALNKGFHEEKWLALARSSDLSAFYGTLRGVKMVTLAPELPLMLERIAELHAQKIVVALGHSSASLELCKEAVKAGASVATHLFNGMAAFHHRKPGLLDAVLLEHRLKYTLICDGVHLDEQAIRLAWRLNSQGLILVSDGTAATGMPEGVCRFAGREIEVRDGAAFLVGSHCLAGAAVGLDACVRHLHKVTGCSKHEAIKAATVQPAALIGVGSKKGSFENGADADFIFLDEALSVLATFIAGHRVY
jgi:N-acetylglucosamine-6-phosphate deacetylase